MRETCRICDKTLDFDEEREAGYCWKCAIEERIEITAREEELLR